MKALIYIPAMLAASALWVWLGAHTVWFAMTGDASF